MTSFVLGEATVRKKMESMEESRRHYKKDSRLVDFL